MRRRTYLPKPKINNIYFEEKFVKKINALTSLRFFAALLALLSHLYFLSDNSIGIVRKIFNGVFWEGYIGVTFFFVLSGYILSHSYGHKFKSDKFKTYKYLVGRLTRIYPLHIITLILAIPLSFILLDRGGADSTAFISNIFLTQSFFPNEKIVFSLNVPSWSLSVELFFYLTFPFFILKKNRFLMSVCIACILFQTSIAASNISDVQKHFYNYVLPLSRLLDFISGILLYRFFLWVQKNYTLKENHVNILQLFSVAFLLLFFIMKGLIPQPYRYDLYYLIPMASIIFSFSFDEGVLAKFLSKRFFIVLGEASFSLYLTHYLLIRYSIELKSTYWNSASPYSDIVLAIFLVPCSILLSLYIYYNAELKIHLWLKNNLKNRGWM